MKTQLEDRKIIFDNASIHYWIAGNSREQTLVFFHGWPGCFLLKSGVIQELANHFFVIAVQHPGLGQSDPLMSYYNIFEQNAEVAYEILKKERKENEKVIVMGQSFGGGVASAFAEKYHQNAKALVMIDSIMGGGNSMDIWTQFWLHWGAKLAKLIVYLPKSLQKIAFWEGMGVRIEMDQDWNKIYKTVPRRIKMIESYAKILSESNKSKAALIDRNYSDLPIIMLWGDKDGKEFSRYGACNVDAARRLANKMSKYNKHLKFITVYGGHTILYERPNYVIGELLKNLPGYVKKTPSMWNSLTPSLFS